MRAEVLMRPSPQHRRFRPSLERLEDRLAPAGDLVFAQLISNAAGGSIDAKAIALDSAGNVFLTGNFQGPIDFGDGVTLNSRGSAVDAFVAEYTPNGGLVWADDLGGSAGRAEGQGIAVDGAGEVCVTGWFSGTVNFDPGTGAANLTSSSAGGEENTFVAKLSPAGALIWAGALGMGCPSHGNGIAVDSAGNAFVTGFFEGTGNFDPAGGSSLLTSVGAFNNAYVTRLDAGGNLVWAVGLGTGSANAIGQQIALDGADNVYTTGTFSGAASFDPTGIAAPLVCSGIANAYVSRLDSNGRFVWADDLGAGSDYTYGTAIAVDGAGNVCTTGYFHGTGSFDPTGGAGILTSTSDNPDYGENVYVSKLDTDGGFVWADGLASGADYAQGTGIAVDAAGNVYASGIVLGTASFDPTGNGGATFTTYLYTPYVVKLDTAGQLAWADHLGSGAMSALNAQGPGVAVDGSGNVYTTGSFSGTGNFDPGSGTVNLTSGPDGYNASYLVKLADSSIGVIPHDSHGHQLPVLPFVLGPKATHIVVGAVTTDSAGNVFVTGSFLGMAKFGMSRARLAAPVKLTSQAGKHGFDAFVAEYDAHGLLLWVRDLGGKQGAAGQGITTDAAGNVYITGAFQGTAHFGVGRSSTLTAHGQQDGFEVKLNRRGGFVWVRDIGTRRSSAPKLLHPRHSA
jgi:hypothetical protein